MFKVKPKKVKDGAQLPIKLKSAKSRGYIAPNEEATVPVFLLDDVVDQLGIGSSLENLTTLQVLNALRCVA